MKKYCIKILICLLSLLTAIYAVPFTAFAIDDASNISKDQCNEYTLYSGETAQFTNTVTLTYGDSSGRYSSLVKSYSTRINNTAARTFNYTYDSNGNITRITDNYNAVTRYQYDDLGQLIREDNPYVSKSYVFTYDNNGNRTSKKTYAYTTGTLGTATATETYTYGDSTWGDRLTSYKGHTITYDEIGNPLTYFVNGSTYNYTWSAGRRLTSATKGSNTYSFTYNDEGIRTSKTVNGVKHTYLLEGSRIISEQWGNHHIIYVYDETGAPVGMYYRTSSYAEGTFDVFYFEKNLQGDIIGVYNSSGTLLALYDYDAWGNCTAQYASGATSTGAVYNPFRYRGYYYDTDLGLYYLNSRYYDPNTGRFINPDDYTVIGATPTALTDKNLYAYCDNNPITRADDDGEFWHIVVGSVIGAVIGGVSAALSGEDGWGVLIGIAGGAASGALAASGLGVVGQAIGSAAISMASNALTQIKNIAQDPTEETKFNVGDMLFDGAVGAICGARGGNGASYGNTAGINSAGKQLFKRGFFNQQARDYYFKNAHQSGGKYVFKALLESFRVSSVGSAVVTAKNISSRYLP